MKKFAIQFPAAQGTLRLKSALQSATEGWADKRRATMEFHIRQDVRLEHGLETALFSLRGNVVLADFQQVRKLTNQFNAKVDGAAHPESIIKASQLNAMGLIDEILHYMVALYRQEIQRDIFETALERLNNSLGEDKTAQLLESFGAQFPPQKVYTQEQTVTEYLESSDEGESCKSLALEELMLLALANLNPAFKPFVFLFDDKDLETATVYNEAISELRTYLAELPPFGPDGMNLWDLLRAPALASDTLSGQLDYMRSRWGLLLSKFIARLLLGLDVIKEEEKPSFFGPGPTQVYTYDGLDEYERFSPDQEWMPRTVLMAKSTLVWLFQLSKKYAHPIERLDQIPDEELDELARRGFTGLWLIGLWERSNASKTIKQWTGNPEAAASAYSLHDYDIAGELGGWGALTNLRERCFKRGIRLGSDMVPNHTGIDSRWVMEHPDRFLQLSYPPFPTYTFNGGNLSNRDGITVQIEDHYYNRSDAAVVFKRIDHHTGDVRYIYHGNDGTSMPWNDTAQIDFLNPEAREAVIRTIIGVCQQFSIVRFDAAMTLAKRHIQRLWYPEPGHGGDIASRSEHAIDSAEFNRRIPNEFWREVVDRCAAEAPHTLLLAEAFWMMESYFVRTLGMHRVYNSAFMNMLKNEENAKYRATIKNTLEFDPEILKRFVNFMNNPDEDTAVAQFGKGDKYFGIATLLVTMPGLPMFGHGQVEGYEEKYGMEYRRAYRDEQPDRHLVDRHEHEIFPLMKKRHIYSGSVDFCLYDLFTPQKSVNENVFAYSNRAGDDRSLVLYNNAYSEASGWIHRGAVAIPQKDGSSRQDSLSQALGFHGTDKFFALLKEQRQDLWYIRSSKEIAERGLFVSLRGYEAQVFIDIQEVEDDSRGRFARLHAELNGRGVKDVQAAIQDTYLGELYYRFTELFKQDIIDNLLSIITKGPAQSAASGKASGAKSAKKTTQATTDKSISVPIRDDARSAEKLTQATVAQSASAPAGNGAGSAEELFAALKTPALNFIAAAEKFLDGAEGQYDPFTVQWSYPRVPHEQIRKGLTAYFERLIALIDYGHAAGKKGAKPADRFLQEQGAKIIAKPSIAIYATAYGALTLLRDILGAGASGAEARALAEHWSLDRKLRECFTGLGIAGDEAGRVTEIMKAVLARTSPVIETPTPKAAAQSLSPAETLILKNYHAEDFRKLLGVNLFEDVVWFNKEAFEEALFYAPLFIALDSAAALEGVPRPPKKTASKVKDTAKLPASALTGDDWLNRVAKIGAITEAIATAEAKSGYRLDGLLEALGPQALPEKPKRKK
ncbi:alpha amylase catalytic region [Treponema primitia ZAS-2]|uniref:Alpha amylase catalytic region n=1 Tax=Treponema primitia (strain ATCC BAA-887 / DSM 12427 / ZAS-2) TaxID=545694 RepID=F5YLK5_TREPZ|nr:alpha-amylase family glycosyl hydrolase [Treponema primitia]AEF84610.1 alpha amylase catalytic region [Treponema primitia ZAS-2]